MSIDPAPTITFTEFFAEKTILGAPIAQNIKIQDPNPTLMLFICMIDGIATFGTAGPRVFENKRRPSLVTLSRRQANA